MSGGAGESHQRAVMLNHIHEGKLSQHHHAPQGQLISHVRTVEEVVQRRHGREHQTQEHARPANRDDPRHDGPPEPPCSETSALGHSHRRRTDQARLLPAGHQTLQGVEQPSERREVPHMLSLFECPQIEAEEIRITRFRRDRARQPPAGPACPASCTRPGAETSFGSQTDGAGRRPREQNQNARSHRPTW